MKQNLQNTFLREGGAVLKASTPNEIKRGTTSRQTPNVEKSLRQGISRFSMEI
jgi:hypothetical protein